MISNFTESDLIATLRSNRVEIVLKFVRFDLAIQLGLRSESTSNPEKNIEVGVWVRD